MLIRPINSLPTSRPRTPLFCRVRNEAYFVPHLLRHYRALGVDHFYFADDKSTDGTREMLLTQSDCTVLDADFSYAEMVDGVVGKRVLALKVPEEIIGAGWVLSVDADEFLVLPPGFETLGELTGALDAAGHISCIASMVDFYPATLNQRAVDRDLDPFKAFPYFDLGPYFLWRPGACDPFLLHAGVRHRLNEWKFATEKTGVFLSYRPTWLHKVPLIKWGHGMVSVTDHTTNIPPYIGTQLALAHFKFYPDLDIKIRDAVDRKSYYGNSFYYQLLDYYLKHFGDRNLIALVTREYHEPEDLVRAALMYVGNLKRQ